MNKYTVYIDGAAGTTGLQIEQRLSAQQDIELITLNEEVRKSLSHRLAAVRQADVSMLCLPDAAAKELVQYAQAQDKICDASTAHRTAPGWVYGFAELEGRRELLKGAHRVAVPGCHAGAFLSVVAPLVQRNILSPDAHVTSHSLTGYSGGGKAMIAGYENKERSVSYDAPRIYALGLTHKHLPEMMAISGLDTPPLFSPIVADYYSGLMLSVPFNASQLTQKYRSVQALFEFYSEYYAGERLVRVMDERDLPSDNMLCASEMAGLDEMQIYVLGNNETPLVVARMDNLGKGAAGSAIQCLNLMLGRDEYAGLRMSEKNS